ncbi:MAG: hypothetical protein ACRBCL_11470 [Maritimibacter sp.]
MILRNQSWLVYGVWGTLVTSVVVALWLRDWPHAFVGAVTLLATMVPALVAERYDIRMPVYFFAGIVLFIFGTLFLGEALDFYNRFWWWDIVLHGSSALGFGLVGVTLALLLFEGDRYAAPPWALAAIAFTFALAIGALWEIFEFLMDSMFGFNMQKSGLVDTMSDLIVDTIGAFIGAMSGYLYLAGRANHGLPGLIAQFVARNRRLFRKAIDELDKK